MANMRGRRSQFGFPAREHPSKLTATRFSPTGGWSPLPNNIVPLGSITSGKNMWFRDGRMMAREGYQVFGGLDSTRSSLNSFLNNDNPVGAHIHYTSTGSELLVVFSKSTVAALDTDTSGSNWTSHAYNTSPTNDPLSGGTSDTILAVSAFLPRLDDNVLLFTNGVDRPFLFHWDATAATQTYSTLSGSAPICEDMVYYDVRPVMWNTTDTSTGTRFVQRLQWPVRGDPEDWTGIGSGEEDLVEMRGEGTRIFSFGQRLLLASDRELWVAIEENSPFVFNFQPLTKQYGIPYKRAAIQVPAGVMWLNSDYMIYLTDGQQVQPIGEAIHRKLRSELADFGSAFFSYNASVDQATLHYTDTAGTYPNKAFTFNFKNQTWAPQAYTNTMAAAAQYTPANTIGYRTEALISSTGTSYSVLTSATSDNGTNYEVEAVFPGFFGDEPDRNKYVDDVRITYEADSVSNLTIEFSVDGGTSYSYTTQTALQNSGSAVTQERVYPNVTGIYGALRLRSEDTNPWELHDIFVRARVQGEGF